MITEQDESRQDIIDWMMSFNGIWEDGAELHKMSDEELAIAYAQFKDFVEHGCGISG